MIEIYLKYDNMHAFGMINAFNCINNHIISCINSMLSHTVGDGGSMCSQNSLGVNRLVLDYKQVDRGISSTRWR